MGKFNWSVHDLTAPVLDIFTKGKPVKASLQANIIGTTGKNRMWTHLERQAEGQVKGMGEKQIEVDEKILRAQRLSIAGNEEAMTKYYREYDKAFGTVTTTE
ncbi:hypothetical protein MTR67_025316 [Solanum verrucosum]|uniref:Uncharacterized protein n=1 Tax=Solanum verrucosum TaxID=315347 RepID=A0AAF0R4V3_SOLVR|nr:hypothetical protein MTR67_025316 [Solanum verrucosum]